MSISGIVITLQSEPSVRQAALALLRDHPGLSLGPTDGLRVPAVLEADSVRESRDSFELIQATAGVAQVDLVYVHFDEEAGAPGASHGSEA